MKKLLFILMLIPGIGLSQSIGIKGGLLGLNTNNMPDSNGANHYNFNYGIVYQHHFNRIVLSIEPGINNKGFSYENKLTDKSGNKIIRITDYKYKYFEVPILIGYNILNKNLFFGINAGISNNFLIKGSAVVLGKEYKISGNNSYIMDIVGGGYIGYNISKNINASLNLRYGKGLKDIHPYFGGYSYFQTQLNINYKF